MHLLSVSSAIKSANVGLRVRAVTPSIISVDTGGTTACTANILFLDKVDQVNRILCVCLLMRARSQIIWIG